MAIDASVPAAVKIVWFDCAWRFRNMRVKVAIVTAKSCGSGVIKRTARIGVEMRAPVMRPLPAVPRIETIVVLDVHYAWPPVVIDVDVIKADVIVIEMMPPTPFVWSPPWMAPCPQPVAGAEPETEADPPVIREASPEAIGAGPADPIASNIRRIVPTRAVHHDIVRAHFSPQVT